MERIELSEEKVFEYVIEALSLMGYPEEIDMHSYIGDNGKPCYYFIYEEIYHGENYKRIKRLKAGTFANVLKYALETKGFNIENIEINSIDEKLCYSVDVNVINHGEDGKHNRRR